MRGERLRTGLPSTWGAAAIAAWLWAVSSAGQTLDFPAFDPAHPAVGYAGTAIDPVAVLAADLRTGARTLEFQERAGYLGSLLHALDVPVESQIVVFSRTSLQAPLISSRNPRWWTTCCSWTRCR